MNVTVLMGSPFTDGATARLTEAFIRGAREAGHDVKRYDVCELDISPCTREYFAKLDAGEDPDTDDMREILASVLETDVVVFASPLYYYGISAQLKTVMDRFYSKHKILEEKSASAVLIANCAGAAPWSMHGLMLHYDCVLRYLRWRDAGHVFAYGLSDQRLEKTGALEEAYRLGLSLKKKAKKTPQE